MAYAPICHRHSQRHNLHCSNLLRSYTFSLYSIYMYVYMHVYIVYIYILIHIMLQLDTLIVLYCIVLYCINYELCSCYIIELNDKHYYELKNE